MKNSVEFTSGKFSPFLPEDCQVNPGRHGAELAYWISRKLAEKNVFTSYPNEEDWGWYLDYILESGEEYMLACGNVDQTENRWLCFLQGQKRKLFSKKRADLANAAILLESLREILEEEPSISDIKWFHEEH